MQTAKQYLADIDARFGKMPKGASVTHTAANASGKVIDSNERNVAVRYDDGSVVDYHPVDARKALRLS